MRRPRAFVFACIALLIPAAARAATGELDLTPILLGLVVVLIAGRLFGSLFEAFRLPAVLGELLAGVVLGNLTLIGITGLQPLGTSAMIHLLAQIGVLFLLFEVGLESDVAKMMQVGASSLVVAVLGVIAPMILGYFVTHWFFPNQESLASWFVGATLCATSVGITARVLKDIGRIASPEGRIILGAAVIDDVLGLIVLAVVQGIIVAVDVGTEFHPSTVLWIVGKAVLFLGAAVFLGRWLSRRVFQIGARLAGDGLMVSLAIAFCFAMSWAAARVGLAPIVGAFAAGLVVDETHYRELRGRDPKGHEMRELLRPIATFLVPVFFVMMGMGVDLRAFARGDILAYAAVLTLVAVLGKQVCALGVFERGADRLAVGLGMIPRGEVGLIFAGIGATLTIGGERVITSEIYSAVIVMVALTTLLTPPLLVWKLRGNRV